METKTNRHIPAKINQQEATKPVIVSRLRAGGLQWERLWTMKTSKRALFKTLLKEVWQIFVFGGSADTLMKTKKWTRGAATAYWQSWLSSSPEELITMDHDKPMRTLVQEMNISIANTCCRRTWGTILCYEERSLMSEASKRKQDWIKKNLQEVWD